MADGSLTIYLPAGTAGSGEVEWRAGVAASNTARASDTIGSYELRTAEGAMVSSQNLALTKRELGPITEEEATQRAAENLDALRGQLPPGSITDARATILPITEEHHFAVLVDVTVADAAQLHGYADELESTPVANLENAEGSAIEVRDPAGHQLDVWRLPRLGSASTYVDPAYSGMVTEPRAWTRPPRAPLRPRRSARGVRIQVTGVYCDRAYDYRVVRHRHDVTVTVLATRLADASGVRCAPPFPSPVRVDLKGRLGRRAILDGSVDPPVARYKRPSA